MKINPGTLIKWIGLAAVILFFSAAAYFLKPDPAEVIKGLMQGLFVVALVIWIVSLLIFISREIGRFYVMVYDPVQLFYKYKRPKRKEDNVPLVLAISTAVILSIFIIKLYS